MLKQRGVYGDIVIGDIPVDWVPYDTDILSLEREYVFRVSTSRPLFRCTPADTCRGASPALEWH